MRSKIAGVVLVLVSALSFALATTIAKFAVQAGASVPHVTWLRFASGFIVASTLVMKDRSKLKANQPFWIAARAISNTMVVFLLFYSVQFTTVSKANILNLTYPVFVFLFAPLVTKEKITRLQLLSLATTLVGVVFVVRPFRAEVTGGLQLGDMLAIGSALAAGFAIAALRRARRHDDTTTILFYLMAVGLTFNTFLLLGTPLPESSALGIAATAGAFGAIGQFAFTGALRTITAPTGAVISTARILFATVLGVWFFADPIDAFLVFGAILVMGSIAIVSLQRGNNEVPDSEVKVQSVPTEPVGPA